MKLHIGKILIRIHGILPALWFLAILLGIGNHLIPPIAALLFHELGHFLAARLCKLRIEEMEIMPYGGVMSIAGLPHAAPLSCFILSAAGPFFSILGFIFVRIHYTPSAQNAFFLYEFARHSLLLFLLNLFPALPMDGGRMVRALLSRRISYEKATKALIYLGFFLGFSLCLLSVFSAFQGHLLLAPAFAGCYLLYAASLEGNQGFARYASSLISLRQRMDDRECIEMEHLAVGEKMPLSRLMLEISQGKIHRIHVLTDDGMQEKGIILDADLWDALMEGKSKTAGDLIKKRQAF